MERIWILTVRFIIIKNTNDVFRIFFILLTTPTKDQRLIDLRLELIPFLIVEVAFPVLRLLFVLLIIVSFDDFNWVLAFRDET